MKTLNQSVSVCFAAEVVFVICTNCLQTTGLADKTLFFFCNIHRTVRLKCCLSNTFNQFSHQFFFLSASPPPLLHPISISSHPPVVSASWPPDPLHAYLGLCGLSLIGEPSLRKVHPALNITQRAFQRLQQLQQTWKDRTDSCGRQQ